MKRNSNPSINVGLESLLQLGFFLSYRRIYLRMIPSLICFRREKLPCFQVLLIQVKIELTIRERRAVQILRSTEWFLLGCLPALGMDLHSTNRVYSCITIQNRRNRLSVNYNRSELTIFYQHTRQMKATSHGRIDPKLCRIRKPRQVTK